MARPNNRRTLSADKISGQNKDKPAETESAKKWQLFPGIAGQGRDLNPRCLSCLKTVAVLWGRDIVQHYRWALKGRKFCDLLRTAAYTFPCWEEAIKVLNTSRLSRLQESSSLRVPLETSSPIRMQDLTNLRICLECRQNGQDRSPFRTQPFQLGRASGYINVTAITGATDSVEIWIAHRVVHGVAIHTAVAHRATHRVVHKVAIHTAIAYRVVHKVAIHTATHRVVVAIHTAVAHRVVHRVAIHGAAVHRAVHRDVGGAALADPNRA
ncbi:hypothetical protein B0T24DRAFT_328776 [Lasiosphaeria ovina]|uniref:Uncharacterized protein n=1 Tax=Lasiosphaeria ovina TaxID=92902 RepID=A0AAE0K901_9PEZI|nr:hypothetical protein B0T24DRAFT_328776 [Lasiosphaeria ovina]